MRRCACLISFLLLARPARPADLEIRYSALERIVAEQLFTQDGRRYVKGSKDAKCQYAYLEAPKLAAADSLLRVTARFSGRSALDFMGRCIGLGDSFDLIVTSKPVPRNGGIGFQDTQVTTLKDSYYIRRVRAAMIQSFNKDLKIDIHEHAKHLLEETHEGAPYQQELKELNLSDIRVTSDALVLVIDFKLVVK